MKRIANYWSKWRLLPESTKINFLYASVTLVIIKIGLTLLPFQSFRKLFHKISRSEQREDLTSVEINEIVYAVNTLATILPFELLCLPRALAAKYLLRKVPSLSLEIGIEINRNKDFEAHAWVEKDGNVIIGDWSESVFYQRLWIWE